MVARNDLLLFLLQNYTLTGLLEATQYCLSVRVVNPLGEGPENFVVVMTDESADYIPTVLGVLGGVVGGVVMMRVAFLLYNKYKHKFNKKECVSLPTMKRINSTTPPVGSQPDEQPPPESRSYQSCKCDKKKNGYTPVTTSSLSPTPPHTVGYTEHQVKAAASVTSSSSDGEKSTVSRGCNFT